MARWERGEPQSGGETSQGVPSEGRKERMDQRNEIKVGKKEAHKKKEEKEQVKKRKAERIKENQERKSATNTTKTHTPP